jgi:GT2 family glycosyltransferase
MGYRNGDTIVRAVRSVVGQADADVEVVVVTSGGDDSADRVRDAFPGLAVVESPVRLLPGATRNRGVEASQGAVVAFLEGDCVAEPGWIAARRRLHDAGWPVVASAVTNGDRGHLAAWGFHFGIFGDRLAGRRAGRVAGTDGAAHGCSYVRTALDRVGPFDETIRIGEDTNAALALERLGVPIWYEPSVRTTHWGPRSSVELVRDRYRRGCNRGRTRGPVARGWIGVGRIWLRTVARLPRMWRDAGGDRWWFLASLPWWMAGSAASLVGHQRAGGAGS